LRFRFRLESILRLREKEEEDARLELVRVRSELQKLEDELRMLENEIEGVERDFEDRMREGMSGSEIREWESYMKMLKARRMKKIEEIDRKREEEREKLSVYLERRKERMALEKLKEKRFREFLGEIDRMERRMLDEVAERKHWWSGFE